MVLLFAFFALPSNMLTSPKLSSKMINDFRVMLKKVVMKVLSHFIFERRFCDITVRINVQNLGDPKIELSH